jgi:hypothetical protein
MAFVIDDIKFDIVHKKVFEAIPKKEVIFQSPIDFLTTNTTLTASEAEKLIVSFGEEEITNFIYSKINVEEESCFVDVVNKFLDKTNNTSSYIIVQMLHAWGYKITELFALDKVQLIEVFLFEMIKNRSSINSEAFITAFDGVMKRETVESLLKAFGIKETSAPNGNNDNDDEIRNLISHFQSLD